MMRQALYAKAAVAKLAGAEVDKDYPAKTEEALRQILRYVELLERQLGEVEVAANRRGRWSGFPG